MKLANVISEEAKNTGSIIMHREGLFWRAYERSAFMFTLHLKQYSATKKFFKTVSSEIAFIGFPNQTLNQIIGKAEGKEVKQSESRICIGGFEFDNEAFLIWKNGIDLTEKPKVEKIDRASDDTNVIEKTHSEQSMIIDRIKNFPVISKTPLECQQFIIEIQHQLNGSL
jgi:hypothetical protein